MKANGAAAALWFQPALPFGTAYDVPGRVAAVRAQGLPLLQQLTALAPYEYVLVRLSSDARFGDTATAEQLIAARSTIKDFNVDAMWEIAHQARSSPAAYGKAMGEICALEPDPFITLGKYFVGHGMVPEAANAFQNAFEKARDRVHVANSMEWLVKHHFENGRTDEALKIAKDAADSYSATGLETMASLLEKMQRLPEAEEYFKKIRDRYDDPGALQTFYARNRERSPQFAESADALMSSMFPQGQEKVQVQELSDAPRDGVLINSSSDLLRRLGLKAGDVIVGIDGIRVRTDAQYLYLRDQAADQPMTLTVWNGARYAQVAVNVPKRWMGCDIVTFAAR